jgi:hypothetical protein
LGREQSRPLSLFAPAGLYRQLGSQFGRETHDLSVSLPGFPVPVTVTSRVDLDVNTIKVGVAVKF